MAIDESTAEILPATESLLSKEFLNKTFTSPAFLSNLTTLAHHAHLNFAEGGFIVQNLNGNPVCSELVKSKRIGSIEKADESLSTDIEKVYFLPGKLPHKEKDLAAIRKVLRPNIVFVIHSHPIEKGEDIRQVLRPSTADLDDWQKLRLESGYPHIIDGIVVKHGGDALLLIYQADPTQKEDLYWQQWDHDEPVSRLFQYMKDSGIRYDTLRLNIKSGYFPDQELVKVDNFVVN
ncbi:MAG: hypothetical protein WCV81_05840 [Microgenomates group bacterium]|jgi:hypothetical protein